MLRAAGCVEIEPGDILTCYDADYRPLATVIVGEGHRVEFEADFDGIITFVQRSEERRVGKQCRSRGSPYH